jgi:hypothetical protein
MTKKTDVRLPNMMDDLRAALEGLPYDVYVRTAALMCDELAAGWREMPPDLGSLIRKTMLAIESGAHEDVFGSLYSEWEPAVERISATEDRHYRVCATYEVLVGELAGESGRYEAAEFLPLAFGQHLWKPVDGSTLERYDQDVQIDQEHPDAQMLQKMIETARRIGHS